MTDVTVLGAGGATVTIALSSADNAAAAQTAVNVINAMTKTGLMEMQLHTGAGSLPAPQNFLAGAVFEGTGSSGGSGDQYVFFGATGQGQNIIGGGANFRTVVVAGNGSDLVYANSSRDAQVWLGKNNGGVANYEGKVTMVTEGGTNWLASEAGTTSLVTLAAGGTLQVGDLEGNDGKHTMGAATVNAAADSTVLVYGQTTTVGTVINLQGDGVTVALEGSGSALINPGSHKSIVFGDPDGGLGAATLFGGSGSHEVYYGQGLFIGGSAGGNIMFSSTVAGSATLRAGSSATSKADLLAAGGEGQVLDAGAGNATLIATADFGATGGSTFIIGAAKVNATGFDLGGNTFNVSGGAHSETFIDGRDTDAEGTTGGTVLVSDFISGLDTFQVTKDFNIFFFAQSETQETETTLLVVTGGATYAFFDASADGVQDIFNTDVTKVG
jgi:hypothetical protein